MTHTPSAYRLLRPDAGSQVVLVCDHASNVVPGELGGLGVSANDLLRHIAWDIGAAGLTEALSDILDAPAILSGVSRLVIDCNRQLDAIGLIPSVSDGTPVPGNAHVTASERAARIASWFRPYHDAIEEVLNRREEMAVDTLLISVHSMTASLAGTPRPWKVALSSHLDRRLTDPMLVALRQQEGDEVVGDNQPYDLDPTVDYTVPFHAIRRGWPHLQVEFRQDEVGNPAAQRDWALRFARALATVPTSIGKPR